MVKKIRVFSFLFSLLILIFIQSSAHAADPDPSGLYLTPFFTSYHYDREKEWNESHPATGFDYIWSSGFGIGVSRYPNSFGNESTTVGIGYLNWFDSLSSDAAKIGFSVLAGYVSNVNEKKQDEEGKLVEDDGETITYVICYPSLSFQFWNLIRIDWAASHRVTALVFKIKI